MSRSCSHALAGAVKRCIEELIEETDGEGNLSVRFIDKRRGFGTFGTRRFCEGEQIFVERPLLTVPHTEFSFPPSLDRAEVDRRGKQLLTASVDKALARLDADASNRFFALSAAHCYQHDSRSLGIFQTNAMRTSACGTSSVFALVSRINHSCSPNVLHCWNERHGELTLHAACDIELGTELSISYIPLATAAGLSHQARQARLRDSFGFCCECERCA